jgi:prepilin-type N-terminal cleavage/methylation domain-containing protein
VRIYRAAQVSEKLGISKQTLVRYEKKGILPKPKRNHINTWREYTDEDIQRLKGILKRGFTLIELAMVMVIIGILAALAIPRFEGFYSVKLNSAAKKLVTDIRYVQQMAVSRHESYRMLFYTSPQNSYVVRKVSDSSYAKDPFTRSDFVVAYNTNPQYGGIIVESTSFGPPSGLQFDWQGIPSSGGTIFLRLKDNGKTVSVTANTGKVSLQ